MMDVREGTVCAWCRANARVQHLTSVFLSDVAQRHKTAAEWIRDPRSREPRIAEINYLPGLHRYLSRLPWVMYSEYGGYNSQNIMGLSYGCELFDYVLTSDTLEHVADFDRAMSEVYRVLKPGGKHIFTIPVIWDRETRVRAEMVEQRIIHRLPPSGHGGPNKPPESWLVYNEFGGDVVARIERAGFAVSVHRLEDNPLVATIAAEKV